MTYPGVSEIWHIPNQSAQNVLLLTTHFQRDHLEWKFFSTIATLGTPYDITLQELRIEYLFPADEATEYNWKQGINAKDVSVNQPHGVRVLKNKLN